MSSLIHEYKYMWIQRSSIRLSRKLWKWGSLISFPNAKFYPILIGCFSVFFTPIFNTPHPCSRQIKIRFEHLLIAEVTWRLHHAAASITSYHIQHRTHFLFPYLKKYQPYITHSIPHMPASHAIICVSKLCWHNIFCFISRLFECSLWRWMIKFLIINSEWSVYILA